MIYELRMLLMQWCLDLALKLAPAKAKGLLALYVSEYLRASLRGCA